MDLRQDLSGHLLQLLWPDDGSWWDGKVLSMDVAHHSALIYYPTTGGHGGAGRGRRQAYGPLNHRWGGQGGAGQGWAGTMPIDLSTTGGGAGRGRHHAY